MMTLNLHVHDIDSSIEFYYQFFGSEPVDTGPNFATWSQNDGKANIFIRFIEPESPNSQMKCDSEML